ncbi:predicted protein [Lichtheimia corymbifera JMRC:FSU:9682]|uniref:Uncharacterized protein n=1 Tax=Lichtheimia corymbifera JMRC:FSU:9682 TaxID=1263082 RepID=A0A068SBZ4_9FUNG|nr:predicted protein [Lichtheimia corymbifera JMRC:FSU:9682]
MARADAITTRSVDTTHPLFSTTLIVLNANCSNRLVYYTTTSSIRQTGSLVIDILHEQGKGLDAGVSFYHEDGDRDNKDSTWWMALLYTQQDDSIYPWDGTTKWYCFIPDNKVT